MRSGIYMNEVNHHHIIQLSAYRNGIQATQGVEIDLNFLLYRILNMRHNQIPISRVIKVLLKIIHTDSNLFTVDLQP